MAYFVKSQNLDGTYKVCDLCRLPRSKALNMTLEELTEVAKTERVYGFVDGIVDCFYKDFAELLQTEFLRMELCGDVYLPYLEQTDGNNCEFLGTTSALVEATGGVIEIPEFVTIANVGVRSSDDMHFCIRALKIPNGVRKIYTDFYTNADLHLEVLEIPETVKSMGRTIAFGTQVKSETKGANGSFYIGRLDFKAHMTYIPSSCFANVDIDEIHLSDTIERIGNSAFLNMHTKQAVITLPRALQKLDDNAFYGVDGVQEMLMPDGLQEIGLSCFYESTIRKVILPSSVYAVGKHAFALCRSLQEVEYSPSIKTVPVYAFSNCTSLRRITGLTQVWRFDASCFYNCTSLKAIEFGNEVSLIKPAAFKQSGLESVRIPFVKYPLDETHGSYIEDNAFENCLQLQRVELTGGVERLGIKAFANCNKLTYVDIQHTNIQYIHKSAFLGCIALQEFRFPEHLNAIAAEVFSYGCMQLQRVRLPRTEIGAELCQKLEAVEYEVFRDTPAERECKERGLNYTIIG